MDPFAELPSAQFSRFQMGMTSLSVSISHWPAAKASARWRRADGHGNARFTQLQMPQTMDDRAADERPAIPGMRAPAQPTSFRRVPDSIRNRARRSGGQRSNRASSLRIKRPLPALTDWTALSTSGTSMGSVVRRIMRAIYHAIRGCFGRSPFFRLDFSLADGQRRRRDRTRYASRQSVHQAVHRRYRKVRGKRSSRETTS